MRKEPRLGQIRTCVACSSCRSFPELPSAWTISRLAWLLGLHAIVYISVLVFLGKDSLLVAISIAVVLVWVSVWDFIFYEIPDSASLLLFLLGAVLLSRLGEGEAIEHVLTAIAWPALFYIVSIGYLRLRGRPGLGLGDVKLMIGVGLVCGPEATLQVVQGASLAGIASILLISMPSGNEMDKYRIAFGPYLCFFCWVSWLAKGAL